MEIIIQPTAHDASHLLAQVIAQFVEQKRDAVLGLCTGKTPLLLYEALVGRHRQDHLDFSRVTIFTLDEFVGLPIDHPASYHAYMKTHLLDHINVRPARVHIPDGLAEDIPAACERYEAA